MRSGAMMFRVLLFVDGRDRYCKLVWSFWWFVALLAETEALDKERDPRNVVAGDSKFRTRYRGGRQVVLNTPFERC